MAKKGNPIFAEFKQIFESEEEIELTSPFMINRLMSWTEDFRISAICNRFVGRIPDKLLLLIYRKFIGSKNAPWIKYVKKEPKQEPELLHKICRIFNCNSDHGRQTIELYRRMGIKPEHMFGMEKPK